MYSFLWRAMLYASGMSETLEGKLSRSITRKLEHHQEFPLSALEAVTEARERLDEIESEAIEAPPSNSAGINSRSSSYMERAFSGMPSRDTSGSTATLTGARRGCRRRSVRLRPAT